MEIKEIPVKDLIPDEFNVRKDDWNPLDDLDAGKLLDSIKAQGVLEPLLVRPVQGQKTKYPKGKTYSIVCGGRRWHAAMEARLKTVPAVIRKDLDDIKTLGTSIQENLKRRSMDKIQTAQGIGRMLDIMNGGRTYEQKMKEMTKLFGMKEVSINNYYNIYKLSKDLGKSLHPDEVRKVDTNTLATIETTKHWNKEEKEKAIKILSKYDKSKDMRIALSELKKKTKEDENLGIEEANKEYEREVEDTVGESFDVYLNAKERKVTKDAAKKEHLEINTLIKRNHVNWLKKEGYL